ncbi:MAG: DUF4367 domain-containing protein [Clostridia bacterium]|nr:DUF4367 domain-containing protein [Clostridia bacterium]
MNEYNERTLKNVLQDIREENDIELQKEIEAAANDPLYMNKDGEAEQFAKKYSKEGTNKKPFRLFSKVAAVLLILAIGSAVIPVNVEGRRGTIAELIINFVNDEFFAVDNEDPLLAFEGEYVPTWIPDGYEVESITNEEDRKEVVFHNSNGNILSYMELSPDYKINIDSTNTKNMENIEINGFNAVCIEEDVLRKIMISTDNSVLYIASDDTEINLIYFAKKIENR